MKLLFVIFLLCARTVSAADFIDEKPVIAASINPIYQIILAITKDKSNNVLIINPALSEHDYQLKKSDVKAMQKADLIFYVSDDLEKNFSRLIAAVEKKSQAFELIKANNIKLLKRRSDATKVDPHIWLDPENAVNIAEFITQKISAIDQKNSAEYQKNFVNFKKEIRATEKIIKAQLSKVKGRDYVIYHDGYQYFENYFSLKPLQIMTHDHDSELTVSTLKEFDILAKQGRIKCILGDKQDEKNTSLKLSKNYQIKFATLDLIGQENSYEELLLMISRGVAGCLY